MFTQYNTFQPVMIDTVSPSMGTPYLDSSIDTPFLDNNSADSPPFFDMTSDISPYLMYASFGVPSLQQYNNSGSLNSNNKDVCIARYLESHEQNDIAKLAHDPVKFNGDPSLLLIDKTKTPFMSYQIPTKTETKPSPTIKLETVTEEESDSLFPPLSSSQQSIGQESNCEKDIMSLDEILGFDATSTLSDALDDDEDTKDEAADTTAAKRDSSPTTGVDAANQKSSMEEPVLRKRKASTEVSSDVTTKRKKTATTTTTTKNKSATTSKKTAKPKQVKLYECHLCDHVSKRRYNLSTHIKTHDKSRVKEFDCSQCTKSFDRRHDRDRHQATVHRGERVFNCKDCGSHFSRRDALNRHLVQRHEYDETDLVD